MIKIRSFHSFKPKIYLVQQSFGLVMIYFELRKTLRNTWVSGWISQKSSRNMCTLQKKRDASGVHHNHLKDNYCNKTTEKKNEKTVNRAKPTHSACLTKRAAKKQKHEGFHVCTFLHLLLFPITHNEAAQDILRGEFATRLSQHAYNLTLTPRAIKKGSVFTNIAFSQNLRMWKSLRPVFFWGLDEMKGFVVLFKWKIIKDVGLGSIDWIYRTLRTSNREYGKKNFAFKGSQDEILNVAPRIIIIL